MQLFSSENSTAKCSNCQRHLFFSLSVTLSISVSDLSLKQKDSNKTTKTRTANAQNNNERKKQNLFMPPEGWRQKLFASFSEEFRPINISAIESVLLRHDSTQPNRIGTFLTHQYHSRFRPSPVRTNTHQQIACNQCFSGFTFYRPINESAARRLLRTCSTCLNSNRSA